jgi:tRNA(His) guanylyltransferase
VNRSEFEARMRRGEWFHSLTIPVGMWAVVRMDGRSFGSFTEKAGYDKPFDESFATVMWETAACLLTEFSGLYAFTESDEISLLLHRDFDLFDREVEKLVSLTAATATASFNLGTHSRTLRSGVPLPVFDSRVWIGNEDDVFDYFAWRASDAVRCGLNGWAYWTLRHDGASAAKATSTLRGTNSAFKRDLLRERGWTSTPCRSGSVTGSGCGGSPTRRWVRTRSPVRTCPRSGAGCTWRPNFPRAGKPTEPTCPP